MMPRYNEMLSRLRLVTAGMLMLGLLSACVGPAREQIETLSELNSGETIVVGRIELVPGLAKDEQKVQGIGTANF